TGNTATEGDDAARRSQPGSTSRPRRERDQAGQGGNSSSTLQGESRLKLRTLHPPCRSETKRRQEPEEAVPGVRRRKATTRRDGRSPAARPGQGGSETKQGKEATPAVRSKAKAD